MIYKHELPLIEVEEINIEPKLHRSQWELHLEKQLDQKGKEAAYDPRIKPRENEVKHIEWF